MAKKCKFCFSVLKPESAACTVCKIAVDKTAKDLSPEEKKIYYQCRTLSIMGFLAMVGGILSSVIFISVIFAMIMAEISKQTPPMKSGSAAFMAVFTAVTLILGVIWVFFGRALRSYKRWCYGAGMALYLISFIINALSKNYLWAFFSLLFLFYIASPLTKKILYREI